MRRFYLLVSFLIFALFTHAQNSTGLGRVTTYPYPNTPQNSFKATRWVWDSTLFSSYMDTKTGKRWTAQRDEVFNPTVIIEMRKNNMTGVLEKYDSIVQHFYGPDLLQSMEKYPWCSDGWKDTIQYEAYTQDQKATVKMEKNFSRYYCRVNSGTKIIYEYYDNGSVFTNTSYTLDTSNMWVKSQRTVYYYTDDGRLDSTVQQEWSETNNAWQDQLFTNYVYDSQNRLSQIRTRKIDDSGNLKDTLFAYYVYSGLETYLTHQVWDAVRNNWQDVSREVYIYSDSIVKDDTLLIEYYTQNYDAGTWVNVEDFLYEYDSLKRLITKTKRLWSTNDNQWYNSSRERYEYDENNLLSKYFNDAWFGSSWGNTYVETNYYSQVQFNRVIDRSNEILIFPNPATNYIRITGTPNAMVKIYNLSGQFIYQSRLAGDLLNVSPLQTGIYIIQVSDTKNNNTILKLIKQ